MSLAHHKPVNLFNQFNDEMNRYFSLTRRVLRTRNATGRRQ